jgi:hypothetical protein
MYLCTDELLFYFIIVNSAVESNIHFHDDVGEKLRNIFQSYYTFQAQKTTAAKLSGFSHMDEIYKLIALGNEN